MPQLDDKLLEELLQKVKDDESEEDLLKYVLEKEMTEHLNADKYERAEDRSGHRNGYRERNIHTRVGTLELRVPHDREGDFSSEIFEATKIRKGTGACPAGSLPPMFPSFQLYGLQLAFPSLKHFPFQLRIRLSSLPSLIG